MHLATCGSEVVADAAQCGVDVMTNATKCGTSVVTDAAQCGTSFVTSAAECGTETITSGLQCGFDIIGSFFGWNKKPKSCNVAKSCRIPKTCSIPNNCSVAKSCRVDKACDAANEGEVANECDVPKGCDVDVQCEVAKKCDIEGCTQDEPLGNCTPGLVQCSSPGFACKPSFESLSDAGFRSLPNFVEGASMLEESVCRGFYDPPASFCAQTLGRAVAYSSSFAVGPDLQTTEVGNAYGPNGEYGCFFSSSAGFQVDLALCSAASTMYVFKSFDSIQGDSQVVNLGASTPIAELGMSAQTIYASDGDEYLGNAITMSFGIGLNPVEIGTITCETSLTTVDPPDFFNF